MEAIILHPKNKTQLSILKNLAKEMGMSFETKKEESILFLFGWPINNISDNFNFIFNLSIWNLIKKILENLHILLIEEA